MKNKNISTSVNDCGNCAINNLLSLYNKRLSINAYDKDGLSLNDMVRQLKKYFKKVLPVKIEIAELLKTNNPFIMLLKDNDDFHYVVIFKIKKNTFFILDSLKKKSYSVSIEKLQVLYSNYCILVEEFLLKKIKKVKLLSLPKKIFIIPFISLIETVMILSTTVILQQIIDNGFKDVYLYFFVQFVLIYIIFYKVKEYLKTWSFLDKNMIKTTLKEIYTLPYSFISKNNVDELYYRLFDAYSLKNMMLTFIFDLINDILLGICSAILIFYYHLKLALFLFILLIPICLFTFYIFKRNCQMIEKRRESEYQFISTYRDSFKNIDDIYINKNDKYYTSVLKRLDTFQKDDYNLVKINLFKNKMLFLLQSVITMGIVILYALNTFSFLTTGSLIAILNLVNLLFQPILNICSQIPVFSNYSLIKKRLQDLRQKDDII